LSTTIYYLTERFGFQRKGVRNFSDKILSTLLFPFDTLFWFVGLWKNIKIAPFSPKMTITPNFSGKCYPKFFVWCIHARSEFFDRNFWQHFKPTNVKFDSKSNKFLAKIKFSKLLKSTNVDSRLKLKTNIIFEESNYFTAKTKFFCNRWNISKNFY